MSEPCILVHSSPTVASLADPLFAATSNNYHIIKGGGGGRAGVHNLVGLLVALLTT
jgi:hypothetical protein